MSSILEFRIMNNSYFNGRADNMFLSVLIFRTMLSTNVYFLFEYSSQVYSDFHDHFKQLILLTVLTKIFYN